MGERIGACARLAVARGTVALIAVSLALVGGSAAAAKAPIGGTQTPIKHLVVLFQENVPFDHYFGIYPHAANPPGEPRFESATGTPTVNGYNEALLTANPNLATPKRLDRTDGNVLRLEPNRRRLIRCAFRIPDRNV